MGRGFILGIFDIFKKKKNELQKVVIGKNDNEQKNNDMLAIRPDIIPQDVFRLLWFIDGKYKNYEQYAKNRSQIDIEGIKIEISFMGSSEPSAISMNLPIKQPRNIDEIERPSYYPAYASISPEQRWIYLNWLKNIDSDINIGYVFIFYYGLERHLFFGNYEEAFNMVLRLRNKHKNGSFLAYSSNALIAACLFHKREDLFIKYINSIETVEEVNISNIYILAKQAMGINLTAKELMAIAGKVGFTNKRYIRDESNIFEIELNKLLREKYGDEYFVLIKYSLLKCPKTREMILANYSIDENQRILFIPSILDNQAFSDTILEILKLTHENVKTTLKELRKGGKYTPQVQTIKNIPTQEPDEVFKKSVLFDKIDANLFDKNVELYNEGLCPYCNKPLLKRPVQKGKCNECGNTILVKNSVFTGEKLMMTNTEYQKMVEIRDERSRRNWIKTIISNEGLNISQVAEFIKVTNVSIEQALIECVKKQAKINKSKSNYGLYRNSLMQIGNIYERLQDYNKAIDLYLTVCMYDLSGCSNGSESFRKEHAFLAPAVIAWISNLSEKLQLDESEVKKRFYIIASSLEIDNISTMVNEYWEQLKEDLYQQNI